MTCGTQRRPESRRAEPQTFFLNSHTCLLQLTESDMWVKRRMKSFNEPSWKRVHACCVSCRVRDSSACLLAVIDTDFPKTIIQDHFGKAWRSWEVSPGQHRCFTFGLITYENHLAAACNHSQTWADLCVGYQDRILLWQNKHKLLTQSQLGNVSVSTLWSMSSSAALKVDSQASSSFIWAALKATRACLSALNEVKTPSLCSAVWV